MTLSRATTSSALLFHFSIGPSSPSHAAGLVCFLSFSPPLPRVGDISGVDWRVVAGAFIVLLDSLRVGWGEESRTGRPPGADGE